MYILGLTGSISMGKTEAGKAFMRLGVPVYDADREVHRLFAKGGAAVVPVETAFPGVEFNGQIDRAGSKASFIHYCRRADKIS